MKWLAAYIYYSEPWDKLLVEGIKPLADDIIESGLAEKYFFIRYWEKGPHIRLRFYGDEQTLDSQVKPKIETWIKSWLAANPSTHDLPEGYTNIPEEQGWYPNNSIQWIAYEPETERYGGPHALPFGESHFHANSDAVLSVMEEAAEWNYDQALGTAIQMHLSFANALGLEKEDAAEFFSWIFNGWLPMAIPPLTPEDRREEAFKGVLQAFESQYDQQKDSLVPFMDAFWEALTDEESFDEIWLNNWISSLKELKDQLYSLDEEGLVEFPGDRMEPGSGNTQVSEKVRFWSIYVSYVHMINNRLGVKNRDEGYLGFLLRKGLLDS